MIGPRRIIVLGSTGSSGSQTREVSGHLNRARPGAIEVAVVREHAEAAQAALRALATVASLGEIAEVGVETRFVLFPHGNDETAGASGLLDDVQRVAADASWRFTSLSVDRGRMDDVFREVTTCLGGGA